MRFDMKKHTIIGLASAVLFFLALSGCALLNPGGAFYSDSVRIDTNMGSFVVELNPDEAPITVDNFLMYAQSGFYEGTLFHRVIKNFMIQGGGFTESFAKKPTEKAIKNESNNGLLNKRGTIAMARTQHVDSATSQFFINTRDNPSLDYNRGKYGYTVFGEVIEGYDTIQKIENVSTGTKNRYRDVPTTPVVINGVKRLYLWQ